MYFYPGVALIWAAFAFGLAAIWGWTQGMRGDATAFSFARRTYLCFVLSVVGASALLLSKLLTHDFRLAYVVGYSSLDLPFHYLLSTFWAGQEGSFLLWLFWGSLIGLPLWRSAKEQEAPTMIVYTASLLALVAILMKQSPFRFVAGGVAPADGQGLNPLLQNPWMVIHPPIMFIGFASLGVPFAFAVAGLWKRRYDSWIVRSLPWALLSFVTLGTAILMGGYWAYVTLGWGGYWGWDPVENTSLVPWLAVTALLHGMYVQRKKGRYRHLNFALAVIAYVCIVYGTFLTRSGVLADFSVHSFVDLGITGWLVGFLAGALGLGLGALAWRWREIPSEEVTEPFLSKGVFLLLAIAGILACGFVILLGTSAPLITRLGDNPSQVATRFYNVTNSPVALLLVLAMAFLPYVDWKGAKGRDMVRRAVGPMLVGLAAGIGAFALGVRHGLWTPLVAVAVFAASSSLVRYLSTARHGAWTKAPGYLAHAGMAIMIAGIVLSSAFDRSQKATLSKGQPLEVMGYRLTFLGVTRTADNKNGMQVEALKLPDGKSFVLVPKLYANPKTQQTMANPDVRSTPFYDVYASPQSYDPGEPESSGSEATLGKGETTPVGGFLVRFLAFDVDPTQMMEDPSKAKIGVLLAVEKDGKKTPLRLDWALAEQGGPTAIAPFPGGPAGATIRAESPNAAAANVTLVFDGPAGFVPERPARPERLVVDLTVKPMIGFVWGGFYVLMAGGLLALFNRFRSSLKAAELPADPEPAAPVDPAPAAVVAEA